MTPSVASLRRRAARMGYRFVKRPARSVHANNLGGYQLIDAWANAVIDGPNYSLDLEDIGHWLESLPDQGAIA